MESVNYEIAGKTSGLVHKRPVEYEFSLKKHIKTGYFANNRVKIVLYATFVSIIEVNIGN